jgi:hypothetical protein
VFKALTYKPAGRGFNGNIFYVFISNQKEKQHKQKDSHTHYFAARVFVHSRYNFNFKRDFNQNFNTLYRASFIISYYDKQMHN